MSQSSGSEPIITSSTGVNRSDNSGKPNYTLIDIEMLTRLAIHMTKHVESKGKDNWRNACGQEDANRFWESAWRHFIAWSEGVDDGEDHAAALFFNVAGCEHALGNKASLYA